MAAPLGGEVEKTDPEGRLPIYNLGEEDIHHENPGQLTDPDKVRNAKDLLDAADYVDDSPRNHAERNLINFDWKTFDPSRVTDWFSYCRFERFFFNRHF